ncbi:MAG: exo-alpha-sialidase [Chitinispirillaceae bacterium]|nr:exo-alpha-sialidase [Chitinispirillaceae bacterium]
MNKSFSIAFLPAVFLFQELASASTLSAGFSTAATASGTPFTITTGLFDQSKPDDLGLTVADGTESVRVFRPADATDHFSNGAVMVGFKGWLYCQWQSSGQDEDAEDTWVAYSRSKDGKSWSSPMTLAGPLSDGYRSSGGWWAAEDTLVAYINIWPSSVSPRGGHVQYTTSTDGVTWTGLKRLPMANGAMLEGIFEQDPHSLPDGRIIGAAHFQPGLIVSPIYTDDRSGIRGWTRPAFTNMSFTGDVSRELEPSWFRRSDGAVVMVFRDQNSTFRCLASVSIDRGSTWPTPVVTDMPDSRSKKSAGNLPDSTAFMVSNPVESKTRVPLVITLSRDGKTFDKAYVLRRGGSDLQAQRYAGTNKGTGYSYPKSVVWEGFLYVSYATNKEDVEYTRIPLNSISLNDPTPVRGKSALPGSRNAQIRAGADNGIDIVKADYRGRGIVTLYSPDGRLLCRTEMIEGRAYIDALHRAAGAYIVNVWAGAALETRVYIKR